MKYEPVKDHAERKRISALIERCEKEQTMSDLIKREDAIRALRCEYPAMPMFKSLREEWVVKTEGFRKAEEVIMSVPSADRPQGEWIEVSTLREIFGDVQYAHRGNSEAEAVIADVWYEVKDVLKGADDEL